MKLHWGSRLLVAVTGLIVLLAGVSAFILGAGFFPFTINPVFLEGPRNIEERLVIIGSAIVLCALGTHSFFMLFRSGRDKGFILQHTEYGDVNISVRALENMVHQSIDVRENLKIVHTNLHRIRKGLVVDLKISLSAGANIPTIVSTLQKQVKEYILRCSGVEVKEVRVMVELTNKTLPSFSEGEAAPLLNEEKQEPEKETPAQSEESAVFHQRILKDDESPERSVQNGEAAAQDNQDESARHHWSKPEFVQEEPKAETDSLHEDGEEDR